jgi:hypothetical protein
VPCRSPIVTSIALAELAPPQRRTRRTFSLANGRQLEQQTVHPELMVIVAQKNSASRLTMFMASLCPTAMRALALARFLAKWLDILSGSALPSCNGLTES